MRKTMTFKRMLIVFGAVMGALQLLLLLGSLLALSSLDQGMRVRLPAANNYADALMQARFDTVQIQQFLTDASLTGDTDSFKDAKDHYDGLMKAFDQAAAANPAHQEELNTLRGKADALYRSGLVMADAYLKSGKAAGDAIMKKPGSGFDASVDAVTGKLDAMDLDAVQAYADAQGDMIQVSGQVKYGVVLGALLVLAIFLCMLLWLYRAFIIPLGQMRATVVEAIEQLDFSRRIPQQRQDEVGDTIAAFNQLLARMQESLLALQQDAGSITQMVQRLTHDSGQVSKSCAAQSDAASAMATSVEQMSSAIAYAATQAQEAAEVSSSSGTLAHEGRSVIANTVNDIHEISRSVKSAAQCIHGLVDSSQQIGNVVQVIGEIADQTNLLALNAAIEAARAGEMGRGFAVVADEVRKLAERTSSSTSQITQTIRAMQDNAGEAVSSTDEAVRLVDQGVERAAQVTRSIDDIEQGSQQAARMATGISGAISEQGALSRDISAQIERIAAMTSDNNVVARDTHGAALDLDALSRHMQDIIQRYRL